jgi:replicative DNA helicase
VINDFQIQSIEEGCPKISDFHIANNWEKYEEFRIKKKTGLTTGFVQIDKAVRALPGITTLVGATGLGKSYFTQNVYVNLAQQGIPVLLVDKEIGFVNVRTRILCQLSGLTEPAITSGKFIKDEESRYVQAVETLKQLPVYYFDDIKQCDVEGYIKEAGRLHNRRVLLVIDSLNRLILDFENRRADIDSWITLFNNLKLKYDNYLNIWLIAEKNKAGEVKESNTVEYISELWLDMIPTKDKQGIMLDVKKNRNGPRGVVTVLQNKLPFCYQMEEMESVPE